MEHSSLPAVELVVRTIAETAIANETYFCQLDSVVGDGDFGYSLARGFEKVLENFDGFDRSSPGAFLKKVGLTIASRVGGTSGPIWGTAFLRAGTAAGAKTALSGRRRGGYAARRRRGHPGARRRFARRQDLARRPGSRHRPPGSGPGGGGAEALANAAQVAERAAAETSGMLAKRGRAAYTGERSIGSPDPGAVAIGVIASRVSAAWREYGSPERSNRSS
jgi:dihydroxyacetone kinase-like protein